MNLNFMHLINALPGVAAQGLIWGIMAIGVYITYKILDVADLTVDGTMCTGGAVYIMLTMAGLPWPAALLGAFLAGLLAGLATGLFHTLCGIPAILAGILTQLALYSVNLRIMGQANRPINSIQYDVLLSSRDVRALSIQNPIFIGAIFVVVIIAVLFVKKFGRVVRLRELRPFPSHQLRHLLRIGVPTGGESLSYNMSQICIQTVCNNFASFVVNTRVYANMFANITYMFGSAISQAAQVVAARLMGAGDVEGTDRRVKLTLVSSIAISGAVSVLLAIFCRPLYSLFTRDPQVLELAQAIMLIEIPLELGRAVNMTMCRALQACGDIRFPIVICVIDAWLVGVGGSILLGMVFGMGLKGLWIAMACDECIRAGLFLWRWHSRKWAEKRLLNS